MEFRDNQAIYLQIADHIMENILLKKWRNGDRLPSVRDIAVSFEVNPNTVMRTFTFLQDKEIIFNKRGIGYFVSFDGHAKTLALRKEIFITEELPHLFRTMEMLGIKCSDLERIREEGVDREL